MKNMKLAIGVFATGVILDYVTTFYALSRGFIETHPFSNILKLVAIIQFGILILIKMKPEWIDLLTQVFCISVGMPLIHAGILNIMTIGGI